MAPWKNISLKRYKTPLMLIISVNIMSPEVNFYWKFCTCIKSFNVILLFQTPAYEPRNKKFVYNAKDVVPKSNKLSTDEFNVLIHQVREAEFNAKTLVFDSSQYIAFNCNQRMMKDVARFYVDSNSLVC